MCTQAQEPEAAISIKEVFDVSSMQIVTVHVKAFVVGEPEEVRPKNIIIHCTWRVLKSRNALLEMQQELFAS